MNETVPKRTFAARLLGPGALALFFLAGCGGSARDASPDVASGTESDQSSAVLFDHHIHLWSDSAAGFLRAAMTALGQGDSPFFDAVRGRNAEEVIVIMDSSGVRRAQVISSANMFASPMAPAAVRETFAIIEAENEESAVRGENDFLAGEVARYADRLVGICSLNPLADYAVAEVRRCADDPRIRGLKLHFGQSGVDLRNPEHLARLRAVFQAAAVGDLVVLLHLRTLPVSAFSAEDARTFIEEVLVQVPDIRVQLAHLAGFGLYDHVTDATMAAFAEAFRTGALSRDRFTFDISLDVPIEPGGDDVMSSAMWAALDSLPDRIRAIGVDRVLFASDWPGVSVMGQPYAEALRRFLRLTDAEFIDILNNAGPLLR